MMGTQSVNPGRVGPSGSAAPTWRLVAVKELTDLWIGGKALILLILYSIVLGILTYQLVSNSELSLIPPREMVYETLKIAIAVGLFIGMIIGVDSISGERERATLEMLLLTPTSRRQIVLGKFLAAVSPWPAAFAITVPYLAVLSQGDPVLGQAVLWGAILGSVMALGFASLGMLVSFCSNSNKTSFFVSLGIYALFLLPTQLPGRAQSGAMGQFLQWANPQTAATYFLSRTLVFHRTVGEFWPWLVAPVLFAALVIGVLLWYAGPRLRLEAPRLRPVAGKASRSESSWGRAAGMSVIAYLMLTLGTAPAMAIHALPPDPEQPDPPAQQADAAGGTSPAKASPGATTQAPVPSQQSSVDAAAPREPEPPQRMSVDAPMSQDPQTSPQISVVDLDYKALRAGDHVLFDTVVTNTSMSESPPMTVAMNIVNLNKGADPVDPEDWSPQRTQGIEPLAPGESTTLSWRVNAILDGDYMVYMVVIPEPAGPQATSRPVASSGIHLMVEPFTRLNPAGMLPLVVGMPAALTLGGVLLLRRRRV
jgi:ABC-type transport system involved in cytochrome c biogenesis permease component